MSDILYCLSCRVAANEAVRVAAEADTARVAAEEAQRVASDAAAAHVAAPVAAEENAATFFTSEEIILDDDFDSDDDDNNDADDAIIEGIMGDGPVVLGDRPLRLSLPLLSSTVSGAPAAQPDGPMDVDTEEE